MEEKDARESESTERKKGNPGGKADHEQETKLGSIGGVAAKERGQQPTGYDRAIGLRATPTPYLSSSQEQSRPLYRSFLSVIPRCSYSCASGGDCSV